MGRKKGSGKNLECLKCDYCKTVVFRDTGTLLSWCGRKSIKPNKTWIEEIRDLGRVRLLWCSKQHLYSSHGLAPRNAAPRHTASLDKILNEEKKQVFISNSNKKTFIYSERGTCPMLST